MDYKKKMMEISQKAQKAAGALCAMSSKEKNALLISMSEAIRKNKEEILKANDRDMSNAIKAGRTEAFIDRLKLSDQRIEKMAIMLEEVAQLPDPVGDMLEEVKRPNGLIIRKVSVPIGVIGIIYESRPNVTADCAGLCLKSGNSVILRGGSAAFYSNRSIFEVLKKACLKKVRQELFFFLEDTSRELVNAMLKDKEGIDLIMPRGGESLIRMVAENSHVPVIKHYKGLCHTYVDSSANKTMAERICFNAKVQRPGVCNAMETLIVHRGIADEFLPSLAEDLFKSGVSIKGCCETRKILGKEINEATEEDYNTEWLDLVLNVKVVGDLQEAIEHINRYGSKHSDAIITEDEKASEIFKLKVDSSTVYVNASTRFTDGGEFGKGAEIGISTDKLHARGPMGLKELTTYKYIVSGNGQIRE